MNEQLQQWLWSVSFFAARENRRAPDGIFDHFPVAGSVLVGGLEFASAAHWLIAADEQSAEARAVVKAKEVFAPSCGWQVHRASVLRLMPARVETVNIGFG